MVVNIFTLYGGLGCQCRCITIVSQQTLHAMSDHGEQYLIPFPPDDVLPDITQFLNSDWFDEKVDCSVRHTTQNNACLSI